MQTPALPAPVAESDASAVVRHSALVSLVAFVGKPLALVRDVLVTRAFGASAATDALYLAMLLPLTVAQVVAGGGLRIAFQPELARRAHVSAESASRFGVAVLLLVGGVAGMLSLGLGWAAQPLATLLASKERAGEVSSLLRVLAPMLLLFSVQDVLTGILHVRLRFFWPSMESVVRNSAIIAMILAFASAGIYAVAYGHLLGTLVLVVACAWSARRAGLRLLMPGHEEGRSLKRLLLVSVPATLGGAIFPACAVVDRMLAARLPDGSVSALAYAESIWALGLIVAGSMSVVALPVLSGMMARGEDGAFAETLRRSVRGAALVTVPVAALLAAMAYPIVELLFMRGKFQASDVALTAEAVLFFSVGLPFIAVQGVSMRALQARSQFNQTARLAVLVIVLHVVQTFLLMTWLGHRGIALGHGLSAVQIVFLVDRRLKLPAPGRWAFVARLAACAVACYLAARQGTAWAPAHAVPFVDAALSLAVGGVTGTIAFVGAALLLWGRSGWSVVRHALRRT